MFEWLECEIDVIKMPDFHHVDGPADAKLKNAVEQSSLRLPSSYKQFVFKFGSAKLYKDYSNNSYRIGIFAGPRLSVLKDGVSIYHIGFHDGASVYIKPSFDSNSLPIFEFEEEEERAANSFEEWLKNSCAKARKTYDEEAWGLILRGPTPFTEEERQIVGTRRLLLWKVLGIDKTGNHIFEITNKSRCFLPALTVGVRSQNGRLNGAVRLNTRDIGPGEKKIVHVDCYKALASPHSLEIFSLSDPKPENREHYWEFREK